MMTCPACGKENEDSAFECRRCRAPLREDVPEEHAPEAAAPVAGAPVEPEASSDALGMVCSRCEAYNEPGVRICTNCGYQLLGGAAAGDEMSHAGEPPLDKTPQQPYAAHDPEPQFEAAPPHDATPPDGTPSLSEELSALAISDEEAAEAGVSTAGRSHFGNGAEAEPPLDKTPAQPFAIPEHEEPVAEPPSSRAAEVVSAGAAAGAATGMVSARRAPEPPPPPPARAPEPVAAPAEKLCASCGAGNPPAAKFCFDCGTPFAKKVESRPPEPARPAPPPEPVKAAPPPPPPPPPPPAPKIEPIKVKAEPPPSIQVAPSIHIDEELSGNEELSDSTAESAAVSVEEPLPEEPLPEASAPLEEPLPEELPAEAAAAFEEPLPEELPAEAAAPLEEPLPEELPAEAAAPLDEPLPEELPVEAAAPEEEPLPEGAELPAEEAFAGEPLPEELPAEAPVEEAPPPFQASLVVEKGAAQGTTFMLAHLENSVGASGAHVELGDDPFVAPHAATLLFADDHLAVRDEGSANGVFVKVRESAPLEPGDSFVAGERLFRYDGPAELEKNGEGETPFLGAPRPQGAAVRVSEVLAGGRTGRTCHRSGPVIAIGRAGCDLNFPADALLAARHAEIRLGDDGSAALVDLGAGPSGVFVRVRAQAQHDLQAGDLLQIGDQLLRLEVG